VFIKVNCVFIKVNNFINLDSKFRDLL